MKTPRTIRTKSVRTLIRSTPAIALVAGIVFGPPPGLDPPGGSRRRGV